MVDGPDISQSGRAEKLSRARRNGFRVVSVLLPFLLLGLLEGVLRLAGLGGYPPVIRRVGPTARGTLVITDQAGAASYFFANRQRPGYNEQYSFYDPKPPRTLRIVLVGESAIKGFPQPRNLASSAFLGEMLKDAWPEQKVEIINLGTTAVASFPVLGMLTEALAYAPDLVIVHTGHNEFFGTYGVASIGWAGSQPWMLKLNRLLRSLALVQGLEKILPHSGPQEDKTLMELMIGRSYTAPDDWRRQAAARNLEYNVGEMIDRCKARGIPILICTQPSNERDLAPLGTERINHLPAAKQAEFNQPLSSGNDLLVGDPAQAGEKFRQAVAVCPAHARAHFCLGKALAALGKNGEALHEFIQARDLDPLPWRAPTLSQQAIVRAANQHGAPICDLEQVFRDASPDGAIGWELMDDHVHPTLAGEALLARALVQSLTRQEGPLHVSTNALAELAGWEVYAQRLGDNLYDRYGVAHTMRVIFDISFMRQTNPKAYERFNELATQWENQSSPEVREVMREWQTVKPHAGGKRPLTGMVARVFMRQGKYAEALELLRIAQNSVPDYTSWHMEYVYFALACQEKLHGSLSAQNKAQALAEIEQGKFLLRRGFSESGLTERYVGRLHQLRGEFSEAIPFLLASRRKLTGFDLVAADEALVVSYVKTGDLTRARQVANNGIEHSGTYVKLYQQMLAAIPTPGGTNGMAGTAAKPPP
jgi:tetratricopeptide (TPR) repeat protein